MQGPQPRTLTNNELISACADRLAANSTLDYAHAIELLRRLNYYTQGKENQTANVFDDRQLELPL
jgi:hypothetical protein